MFLRMDYSYKIKHIFPLIEKIQNLICLNGDPFTTNYMMQKNIIFILLNLFIIIIKVH